MILVINQAIHVPEMEHNLISPMQMRLNDVHVSECPKFLHPTPSDYTHAITLNQGNDDEYIIPLQLRGVTSVFPTRKPSIEEVQQAERIYKLTADAPEWDPH